MQLTGQMAIHVHRDLCPSHLCWMRQRFLQYLGKDVAEAAPPRLRRCLMREALRLDQSFPLLCLRRRVSVPYPGPAPALQGVGPLLEESRR